MTHISAEINCTIKDAKNRKTSVFKQKRASNKNEPKRDDYKKINYSEAITRVKFSDNMGRPTYEEVVNMQNESNVPPF